MRGIYPVAKPYPLPKYQEVDTECPEKQGGGQDVLGGESRLCDPANCGAKTDLAAVESPGQKGAGTRPAAPKAGALIARESGIQPGNLPTKALRQ